MVKKTVITLVVLVVIGLAIGATNTVIAQQSVGGNKQEPEKELYKNCRIAFFSNRDKVRDVYVINWDGSEEKNLTSNLKADYVSSWSPDGKKILFMSARDGNHEIYVMNADGSEQVNLTKNPSNDDSPSLSPDGAKISFESDRDGKSEIYVMDADGSNQMNLTNNPSSDWGTSWSPDGKKISFMSTRDGNYEIYVMNADGSEQKNLTNNLAYDTGASWSPDGSKIAFISDRDGNKEIYVVDSNGSEQKRLTDNPDTDLLGSWSPDGEKIAFKVARGAKWGQIDIYVMNADGSEKKRLTNNLVKDEAPCWSPDGKKIAFASKRTGNFQIYIMNTDGSDQQRLTHHSGYDLDPVWSSVLDNTAKGDEIHKPKQGSEIKSIDIEKIKASSYTRFIENVFWYSQESLDGKRISSELIKTDMQKFKDILYTVLKPECLLSEENFDEKAIAVENLVDANDYILLEYKLQKCKIQIQDGKAIFIGIFPFIDSNTEQSDLAEYVKSVAFRVMNLPKTDKDGNELRVFVSTIDIGNSKCGNICYGVNPDPFQFWYSHVQWWSDGKNVLFLIGKTTFDGEDYSKRAGPPKNYKKPRKFKKIIKN